MFFGRTNVNYVGPFVSIDCHIFRFRTDFHNPAKLMRMQTIQTQDSLIKPNVTSDFSLYFINNLVCSLYSNLLPRDRS